MDTEPTNTISRSRFIKSAAVSGASFTATGLATYILRKKIILMSQFCQKQQQPIHNLTQRRNE